MERGIRGDKARDAAMIGKAGEHMVAAQLMMRGMNVCWPSVDRGYDLMTDNGCRVQVKTGRIRNSPGVLASYGCPVYSFHFPKNRHIAVSRDKVKVSIRPKLADRCDIVVMWGVEENRFWVTPAQICDERQCLFLGPSNDRAFEGDIKDMQCMADLGFSQSEIGHHYGIAQANVSLRLKRAGTQTQANSTVNQVRRCEGAWQNILEFSVALDSTPDLLTKEN